MSTEFSFFLSTSMRGCWKGRCSKLKHREQTVGVPSKEDNFREGAGGSDIAKANLSGWNKESHGNW